MKTSDVKHLADFHRLYDKKTGEICSCGHERLSWEHNFGTDDIFVCSLCYWYAQNEFDKLDELLKDLDNNF